MTRDLFFEYIEDAVIAVDSQGNILDLNRVMSTLFEIPQQVIGHSLKETLGKHFSIFEPFLNLPQAHEEIMLQNGATRYFDLRMWVLEKDGQFEGRWFVLRDITSRKEHERHLHFHAGLLEAVNTAVISTDIGLTIQTWNKAAERL